MHQIHLTDQAYENLAKRAAAYGFASVEAYLNEEGRNATILLDAETVEKLRLSVADARAGRIVTFENYQAEMRGHRAKWLRKNAPKA